MTKEDRCRGDCCKAFPLSCVTTEELQKHYDNAVRLEYGDQFEWTRPKNWYPRQHEGILEWFPWLIPLGAHTEDPVTGQAHEEPNEPIHYFSCSKLAENGDCTVYDRRPHFCRSYGVTTPCHTPGCRWKGALKESQPQEKAPAKKTKSKVTDNWAETKRPTI